MTAEYPDYGTPQAHADRIAATGAPLLTLATTIVLSNNAAIAANTTATLGPFVVGQIGYEVFFQVLANAASAAPFCIVEMSWVDTVNGILAGHERWVLVGGSASGGATFYGNGPTKGNQLTIAITNGDTVNSMTVTTRAIQNSRVYSRDDWRTDLINNPPSFTSPSHQQQSNWLAGFSGNINAGASQSRLCPLYAGRVRLCLTTGAAKGTFRVAIEDPNMGTSFGVTVFSFDVAANSSDMREFDCPRASINITVANTDAVNGVFTASVLVSELLP